MLWLSVDHKEVIFSFGDNALERFKNRWSIQEAYLKRPKSFVKASEIINLYVLFKGAKSL